MLETYHCCVRVVKVSNNRSRNCKMRHFQLTFLMLWLYSQGGKSQLHAKSPNFMQNQKNCICYDKNIYPTIPGTISVSNGVETTLGYLFNQNSLSSADGNIENPVLIRLNIGVNGKAYIGDTNVIINGIKQQKSPDMKNQSFKGTNGENIPKIKYNENDVKRIISSLTNPVINKGTVLHTDNVHEKTPENGVSRDETPMSYITTENTNSVTTVYQDKKKLKLPEYNQEIDQPAVKPVINISDPNNLNINEEYKNFDDWLKKKLETLELNYEIQIHDLRRLVKALLLEHDIIITETGLVIDHLNANIDLSDLKLYPIFIAQSLDAKFFLPILPFNNSLYDLPRDIKYLEGLMLTLYNPPKILGIVPIRTKYMYSAESNEENVNGNSVIYFVNESVSTNELLPCAQNNECEDSDTYHMLLNNLNSDQNAVIVTTEVQEEIEDSISVQPMPSDSTIDSIIELLKTVFDKVEPPTEVKKQDDVYPLYRIIGGNAATSSGTPVSTRGRSGFIDKI